VVSEREKMMVSRIPVGRIGQPVEIANMVRYLASDEAQFITGSDMLVDGGALLPALMDNTYIK
jgi:NAD(P)-dependent dehydrogenase (short-subunit alcohol dehydrogenase family)